MCRLRKTKRLVDVIASELLYFQGYDVGGASQTDKENEKTICHPRVSDACRNARVLIDAINISQFKSSRDARSRGGLARAIALTPARRAEIASKAANVRWKR